MHAMQIEEHARRLMDAHGDKAIAEAAQKARDCERNNDSEQAQTWRQIESALRQMQGPRAS